ncbi:MAG TPA: hypothetical protein VD998_03215 [Verrucomicrobiae bacterium]|nr:hypothetical protein [Verrucomicrobiae bacterium]
MQTSINDFGIVQWFIFGEKEQVKLSIKAMHELGITELRTNISWADWERPGGQEWYDWLVPELHRAGFKIFPSLFYTPLEFARLLPGQTREDARTNHAPEDLESYARFCEAIVTRYGSYLSEWYQVWNEPNNQAYWNQDIDPEGVLFDVMANAALDVLQGAGRKIVLGGLIPPYPVWVEKHRDLVHRSDALGIQAFPGTWDKMEWRGWQHAVNLVRNHLKPGQQIWITETGYSTVTLEDSSEELKRFREQSQILYLGDLMESTADRAYFYSLFDQQPTHLTDNAINKGTPPDPRAYHFGLIDWQGRKKPAFSHWQANRQLQKVRAA